MWFYKPGNYLIKDGYGFYVYKDNIRNNETYYVDYSMIGSLENRIVICQNNKEICSKYLDEIFNKLKEQGEKYVVL
jgi:hypothetical protein